MVNISNLPNEMLFQVFLHLDIESVLSSLLVCKRFHSGSMSNWNRLNKKVNVKTLEILINRDKSTELSLCGDSFGNLKLKVDDALVQCTYDVSAENTPLVRAVIHYFTPKLAYWNYNHYNPSMHRMEFKSVCPMAELRDLLLFLLPLIEIQKIVPVNFHEIEQSHLDCFIENSEQRIVLGTDAYLSNFTRQFRNTKISVALSEARMWCSLFLLPFAFSTQVLESPSEWITSEIVLKSLI